MSPNSSVLENGPESKSMKKSDSSLREQGGVRVMLEGKETGQLGGFRGGLER